MEPKQHNLFIHQACIAWLKPDRRQQTQKTTLSDFLFTFFTDLFSMFKTLFLPHHVQSNGKIPPSMTFQNVSTKLIPLQRGGSIHRSVQYVQEPFLTPPCPMQWQNPSKHDIPKCLNKANPSPKRGFYSPICSICSRPFSYPTMSHAMAKSLQAWHSKLFQES